MANAKKFTRAACGNMFAHYERKKGVDGEYVKFGNQDIDVTKSHLNYNLAPHREQGQGTYIKVRCTSDGVLCLNRKDVNVMCSWVLTQPKEFPMERSRELFEEAYSFLSKRYGGEDNIVSAFVHMDENQPHMHFAFIPIVHDEKKDRFTVAANRVIDRKELKIFHGELKKHLDKHFGFDVGILNGATKDGNLNKEQLKAKAQLEKDVASLSEKESQLKNRVQRYEDLEVDTEVIDNIGKKNLFSNNISVPADKYSLMQEQAKAYCANRDTIDNIREREKKLAEKEKQLQEKEQLLQKKVVEKEQQAAQETKRRNEYFNSRERYVEDGVKSNREYYNYVEKPFYEATSGSLTAKLFEEFNANITTLQEELNKLKADNEKLISDLRNSVPGSEHQELQLSYKQLEQTLQTEKKKNAKLTDDKDYFESTVFVRDQRINELEEKYRGAYESLSNIVMAARMLKHDEGDYKVENLTPKQGYLIDALSKYGEHWAKHDGFPDLADDMHNCIDISGGIQEKIDELTPKTQSKVKVGGGRKM